MRFATARRGVRVLLEEAVERRHDDIVLRSW